MSSSAERRARMVATQLRARGVGDRRVLDAMGAVPRECFVTGSQQHRAYDDCALPLSHGQTISQPLMVARSCELARVGPNDSVLEVGAGSGYQAAVLGLLARQVTAMEIVPQLIEPARQALAAAGISNVQIIQGDGSLGYPQGAPYDVILVAAGAPHIPAALRDQLADGGRLVIPVGEPMLQLLTLVQRVGDDYRVSPHEACVFVPLVGADGRANT